MPAVFSWDIILRRVPVIMHRVPIIHCQPMVMQKHTAGYRLDSFVKKITFQQINKKGIQNIGNAVETMAAAEGLDAHKNAVTIRLE